MTLCPDSTIGFLGLFDLSIAPPLLLYSYVPILTLCILFGVFVMVVDKSSEISKYLVGILISFAIWIFLILIQWVGIYIEMVHLAWQLLILPEISIFLSSTLFTYVFLFRRPVKDCYKNIILAIIGACALALPTTTNISAFDVNNCKSLVGSLWTVVYIFEWLCLSLIILMALIKMHKIHDKQERSKTIIFSIGLALFLAIFWASNYFGELTGKYEINLVGPIGMFCFLGVLSYMTIEFKIFNAKIFSAQILVLALLTFVGALLFIEDLYYLHIVILSTFILSGIFGYGLIRSVKREIEQKEKITKLAVELEDANEKLKELDRQKDELLSIVSHQLATPITSEKWYVEMLLDGDLGKLSKEQEEHLKSMLAISANLSDLVSMILDVSRIQLGRVKIEKQDLDLNEFFKEILQIIEPKAKEKGVQLNISLPKDLPVAQLDKRYTHMTIENLLSNAIKYTAKEGKVDFKLEIKNNRMHCSVKDTGCGIPKEEQDKIFGKLFRASNVRNSVDGNGFGLYVAKGAIEAQGGKIWFESTENVGTTFYIELPLNEK